MYLTHNGRAHPLCEAQRSKVGCSALLCLLGIFQSYYYFSSGVSFFQIPDSLRDLTQRVRSVDDRGDFARFKEPLQNDQVSFAACRQKRGQRLAHEP